MNSSELNHEIRMHFTITHLVLFLQHFARISLLVGDINALETVDILWKTRSGDVSLSCFNSFHQSIMNEDILLLSLNQSIALFSERRDVISAM